LEERLNQLEERNDRLFLKLGELEAKVELMIHETYTVNDVLKLLNEIAYGKDANQSL